MLGEESERKILTLQSKECAVLATTGDALTEKGGRRSNHEGLRPRPLSRFMTSSRIPYVKWGMCYDLAHALAPTF